MDFPNIKYKEEANLRRRRKEQHIQNRGNYYDSNEDEDEDCMDSRKHEKELLPKWKLFLVGGAIFLCFALLYPSVFAPLISSFSGVKRDQHHSDQQRNVHPSMVGPHPAQREARPGRPMHPHPAAASMPQQGTTQTGSRGGFAWLLPFYTVGVVCFLMYTLFKIMFKSKKKKKKRRKHFGLIDEDGEDDSDDGNIYGSANDQKLHSVQARLRKTENAMQEIMQQLELIASQSNQLKQQQVNDQKETKADETKQGAWKLDDLTDEQIAEMEKPLQELKMLSEMCKKDEMLRRRLKTEQSSTEETEDENLNDEEEEEDDELVNSKNGSQTDGESE